MLKWLCTDFNTRFSPLIVYKSLLIKYFYVNPEELSTELTLGCNWMNDLLSAVVEICLCVLLSSKKESFGDFALKGLRHRHTGVPYWTDPSAVSPMCVFDLLAAICHKGKISVGSIFTLWRGLTAVWEGRKAKKKNLPKNYPFKDILSSSLLFSHFLLI